MSPVTSHRGFPKLTPPRLMTVTLYKQQHMEENKKQESERGYMLQLQQPVKTAHPPL